MVVPTGPGRVELRVPGQVDGVVGRVGRQEHRRADLDGELVGELDGVDVVQARAGAPLRLEDAVQLGREGRHEVQHGGGRPVAGDGVPDPRGQRRRQRVGADVAPRCGLRRACLLCVLEPDPSGRGTRRQQVGVAACSALVVGLQIDVQLAVSQGGLSIFTVSGEASQKKKSSGLGGIKSKTLYHCLSRIPHLARIDLDFGRRHGR